MHTRWAILFEEKTHERARQIIEHLAGGGADDYAAYREQVGILKGLREAAEIVEEVDRAIIG